MDPDVAAMDTWLDLAAALDEVADAVAVHVTPAATTARDARGTTWPLKPLEPGAIGALVALLDRCSMAHDGPPNGSGVTRFAGDALTYEARGATFVQIHRWPDAPTWRAALTPAGA